jgi:hypothetical protein
MLAAAGHTLVFRRGWQGGGYVIEGRPEYSPHCQKMVAGPAAEMDAYQLRHFARMTPGERLRMALSMSADVLGLAVRGELRRRPGLSRQEAQREVLHRHYRLHAE